MKVLEIGCGAGGNLISFHESGYEVVGIDLGEGYLNFGKSKGLNLLQCNSQQLLENTNEKFDIIILSHVFEHFLNIEKELETISKLLAEEGFLYIEVPGILNLSHNYKNNLLNYLQNAHTYSFSLGTLKMVVEKYGFKYISGNEHIRSVFKKGKQEFKVDKNESKNIIKYLWSLEELLKKK